MIAISKKKSKPQNFIFSSFLIFLLTTVGAPMVEAQSFGSFQSTPKTEWLEKRDMRLLEDFTYIDVDGELWVAPKGAIVNGASIPQAFWTIMGGPFTGNYRDASIIHDVACDERKRPWNLVHLRFYHGMRASGVGVVRAKIMYAAVYHFGPRWEQTYIERVPKQKLNKAIEEYEKADFSHTTVNIDKEFEKHGFLKKVTLRPQMVSITATITPEPQVMDSETFELLKAAIEGEDLSLEAIRDFKPAIAQQ